MDWLGAIRPITARGHQDRLLWAVRVRWLVIGGFLALAVSAHPLGLFPEVRACILAAVIGAALNGVNHWSVRVWRGVLPISLLAIPMDSVLITYVTAQTGGVSSPFLVMYPVQVVATAMLVTLGAAIASGVVAAGAFAGLLALAAAGKVTLAPLYSTVPLADTGRTLLLGQGAWLVFLAYCLGLLIFVGGYVSERLRRSEDELADKNRRLEDSVRSLERARDDLADAYRRLQAAEVHLVQSEKMRALGELVAGVAHEINNPLSIVGANLEYLRAAWVRLGSLFEEIPALLNDEGRRSWADWQVVRGVAEIRGELPGVLNDCEEGVRRAARIVAELHVFSRAGSMEQAEAVDLNRGVRRTAALLRHRLDGSIAVHLDLRELPEVEGIPGQLDQVFLNLLVNAADAIADEGNIWVETRHDTAAEVVRLRVSDDGRGIDPEHIDRVFDPFFTTKDVGKGTGLGLSISYGIVHRHGGTITVASETGRHTIFEVTLPARRPLALSPPGVC